MSGEPRNWLPATIQWALRRGGGFVCASEVADIKNAAQALSAECARQDAEIDRLQAELEKAQGRWVPVDEWYQRLAAKFILPNHPRIVMEHGVVMSAVFQGDGVWKMGAFHYYPDYVLVGWQPPEPPESEPADE